jgi:hypothetical protein
MNGVVPLAEHHALLIACRNNISVFIAWKELYIDFYLNPKLTDLGL